MVLWELIQTVWGQAYDWDVRWDLDIAPSSVDLVASVPEMTGQRTREGNLLEGASWPGEAGEPLWAAAQTRHLSRNLPEAVDSGGG